MSSDSRKRTHDWPASKVRPGHVILEEGLPAVVVRVSYLQQDHSRYVFWCRYVWQATSEAVWDSRPVHKSGTVRKVMG